MPSPSRKQPPSPHRPPPSAQPPLAEPQYHGRAFDPWNSGSTGHQRAESRGPMGWRESRNVKLQSQFRGGDSGGQRLSDTVGPGTEHFDERHRVLVPPELRARAANSVADMLRKPGTMAKLRQSSSSLSSSSAAGQGQDKAAAAGTAVSAGATAEQQPRGEEEMEDQHAEGQGNGEAGTAAVRQRAIFDGLVIYINGSTHPLISDHKLKRLLAEHGARTSIHLGRRQVTHVILGKPSGPRGGAGGGLAGGKLEKEIRRVGGNGIKFVGVEWVLESIKAGTRQPEARFANLKIAARGQQSVLHAFSKAPPGAT
ncbi:hypothetical protein B0T24DRAFT_263991 [Lasiosphaeria ovina]|uniref:BRCT domain-containing protein n=1 Tax=Lasiosphaeria ovina TaxID=92902 RepID=A0AAE0N7Z6_9PEZI|nr:hypothetical protein B0T24DRAFT_263991 [Lasiosphaeria ovina]